MGLPEALRGAQQPPNRGRVGGVQVVGRATGARPARLRTLRSECQQAANGCPAISPMAGHTARRLERGARMSELVVGRRGPGTPSLATPEPSPHRYRVLRVPTFSSERAAMPNMSAKAAEIDNPVVLI